MMFSNDASGAVTGSEGGGGGGGAEVVVDGGDVGGAPPPPLPASDPCGDLLRRDHAVGMRWGGSMGSITVSMDDMAADMLGFCMCRTDRQSPSFRRLSRPASDTSRHANGSHGSDDRDECCSSPAGELCEL